MAAPLALHAQNARSMDEFIRSRPNSIGSWITLFQADLMVQSYRSSKPSWVTDDVEFLSFILPRMRNPIMIFEDLIDDADDDTIQRLSILPNTYRAENLTWLGFLRILQKREHLGTDEKRSKYDQMVLNVFATALSETSEKDDQQTIRSYFLQYIQKYNSIIGIKTYILTPDRKLAENILSLYQPIQLWKSIRSFIKDSIVSAFVAPIFASLNDALGKDLSSYIISYL